MVPYVVALLMLVTASDARQGNKQFLRPQNEAPLFNGDITHIKGEYVVVLKAKVDVTKHVEKLRQSLSKDERIIAAFDFEPFIGYGAILLDRTVTTLRGNQDVEYIEHNIEAKISVCTEQNGAPWGIRRTVKAALPLQNTYSYNALTAGAAIDVYVLDSGIDVAHVDFGGRASWGVAVDSTQAGGGHHALDGTSMAAPHVSGAVAKYLSTFAANAQPTPAQVKTWLIQAAGDGTVTNVPNATPNKLLQYKDC
eukprot:Em0010g407a